MTSPDGPVTKGTVTKLPVPEGEAIRADRHDWADWFGPVAQPNALMPPFVDPATHRRYLAEARVIDGLTFTVAWRVVGWPRRGPRTWLQAFVDGVEVMGHGDADPAVSIEAAYADFCRFQVGERRLRDFALGSTVDGSLGGLSSLAFLVAQPDALRSAQISPMTHQFVVSEVFDAWASMH